MSCQEHYFENLLFNGKDVKGEPNKNALSEEVQKAIKICTDYVLYSLFCGREDFESYIKENNE